MLQGLFLIAWVVLGGMFLVNVFVGVVFDSFAAIRKEEDGIAFLAESQQQFVHTMEEVLKVQPVRYPPCPANPCRAWCYRTIRHKWFEPFVLTVILLNAALLASDGYGVSEFMVQLLAFGNEVCLVVFVVEVPPACHPPLPPLVTCRHWPLFAVTCLTSVVASEVRLAWHCGA